MKFTKYSPFGKRVLLVLDATEERTEGGLFIPGSAQRPSNTAKVIAIGDECTKVITGMKVFIPQGIGVEIELLDQKCLQVFEGDIDAEIE